MEELKSYVELLFSRYRNSARILELKEEILSNLEAKVEDLTAQGMEKEEAVRQAKASITSVDGLIDGNRLVYYNRYKMEVTQVAVLYGVIAWILTLPLKIVDTGIWVNEVFLVLTLAVGIWYLLQRGRKEKEYVQHTAYVRVSRLRWMHKAAWWLFGLLVVVMTAFTTAVQFGSNFWYSTPVKIDGPYRVGALAVRYLLPAFFMIIPLLYHAAIKLVSNYEVNHEDQNEE